MNNPELGKLITDAAERDAVHIAIFPAIAGEKLRPGEHVGIVDGEAVVCEILLGIVDPFLRPGSVILKGQKCWLLLYPGTITSLKHHWIHPGIKEDRPIIEQIETERQSSREESEKWLRDFTERYGFYGGFEKVIETAKAGGDYLTANTDLHGAEELEGNDYYDFWRHVENYTGQKFNEIHRSTVEWSCSC